MEINYGTGDFNSLKALKQLALKSWSKFRNDLTQDHWEQLCESLYNDKTYIELLETAHCFIACDKNDIVGMAFIVPHGHPTDIYEAGWSYIRFVTVDPEYSGRGIARQLTLLCMEWAQKNGEETIALHTSELMNNARHLYQSLGFAVLKELPERLGKRYWLYILKIKQ